MQSERDRAERQVDESKDRLKTADERRKAAVSEVYSALLCASPSTHCTWSHVRAAGRGAGTGASLPARRPGGMRRHLCPLMVGAFSGGNAAERDRTSARRNVRSGAAARRAPAKVHAGGGGWVLSIGELACR
jgi:hypothetical protein